MRILCIDDDPTARALVGKILARAGHEVVQAASGRAAVALLDEDEVDLVVTDLRMPDMTGLEVVKSLRANPRTAGTAVVVCTADASKSAAAEALGLGVEGYVLKPVVAKALLDIVARVAPRLKPKPAAAAWRSWPALEAPAKVIERLGLDEQSYRELVEVLVESARSQLAELTEHLAAGRLSDFAFVARTMGEGAANLGALGLCDAATEAALQAPTAEAEKREHYLVSLREEIDRVARALEEHVAAGQASEARAAGSLAG